MTFDGLMAIVAIVLAICALADPPQLQSLRLFASWQVVLRSLAVSLILLILAGMPLGLNPPFQWPREMVLYSLTLAAFLIPLCAILIAWYQWSQAILTGDRGAKVVSIFETALREHKFGEVERVLKRNKAKLTFLSKEAKQILFSPKMVAGLSESQSFILLEIASDLEFLKSLPDRHMAIDLLVRDQLSSSHSPLRAEVFLRYGGSEHVWHLDSAQKLLQETFFRPIWYTETSAHYPLTIAAIDQLTSGELDHQYNGPSDTYVARQGVSGRWKCSIYTALKAETLAIEAAINDRREDDLYVTDLCDLYRTILERSSIASNAWTKTSRVYEYPTPFAYLLCEIRRSLRDLAVAAIRTATGSDKIQADPPGAIGKQILESWARCFHLLAKSQKKVESSFKNKELRKYLYFCLDLRFQASEVLNFPVADSEMLEHWAEAGIQSLQSEINGEIHDASFAKMIAAVTTSLDQGRSSVQKGMKWLRSSLRIENLTY